MVFVSIDTATVAHNHDEGEHWNFGCRDSRRTEEENLSSMAALKDTEESRLK